MVHRQTCSKNTHTHNKLKKGEKNPRYQTLLSSASLKIVQCPLTLCYSSKNSHYSTKPQEKNINKEANILSISEKTQSKSLTAALQFVRKRILTKTFV